MDDGLITPAVLESLAGTSAFRRGEAYFSVGAVGRLRLTDDRIAALVEGSQSYQVELRVTVANWLATVAVRVPRRAISASIASPSAWRGWQSRRRRASPRPRREKPGGGIHGVTSRRI